MIPCQNGKRKITNIRPRGRPIGALNKSKFSGEEMVGESPFAIAKRSDQGKGQVESEKSAITDPVEVLSSQREDINMDEN